MLAFSVGTQLAPSLVSFNITPYKLKARTGREEKISISLRENATPEVSSSS